MSVGAKANPGSPRAPATAALAAAFILTGLAFHLVAALVCGIALLALAAGAVAWVELAARGGRLERDRGPGRMKEGELYPLRIRLCGVLLPPPGGELADPLLDRAVQVGPRWRRRLDRQLWLTGPGRRRFGPARLVVRDPLGLWRIELGSGRTDEVVILPRVDPVRGKRPGVKPGGRSGGSASSSEAGSRRVSVAQLEVDGLRPYRDGSPASRIHWPAVARTGEMIERRLVAGGEPRPVVVFDPRGAAEIGHRERAMRATASLCVALARSGGCALVLPGERRPLQIDPALRAWPEAHTKLAVCGSEGAPGTTPGAIGGSLLWVTAGRPPPPEARRRLGPGSFVITTRGSRRTAAFRVSGCFAYPLSGASGGRRAAGGESGASV